MSSAALCGVLAVALGLLALVLNHAYARIALVELALNEGLPPGHQLAPSSHGTSPAVVDNADVVALLPAGVHVFLSRNCHACQRLVDELDQVDLRHQTELHLHYVDRPRPIAASAAARQGAELHIDQAELATLVGADPLPFTVAVGAHSLVSRSVTPTISDVSTTVRDGGIAFDIGVNP